MEEQAPPGAAEAHRFPCPACGAEMRYSPKTDQLTCDHCGETAPMREARPWDGQVIRELDFQAALRNQLDAAEMEETRIVHCDSCGADVEFEPAIHSRECPFCAAPIVTDTGTSRHIKPKGVLPFLLDQTQAREAMNRWLGRLWFAPSGLRDYARAGRPMQGVYVPYWTYDAQTETTYAGERGDAYYVQNRVRVMRDGKPVSELRQVRKVRWTPRRGRLRRFFDDILVLASKSLPKGHADRLGPWDLSALEPYRPEYLAGFRAEAYTVSLEEGFHEARAVMDAMILRDVRFDIGGDEQRVHSVETQLSDITFKHILLPVWLAAYKYSGKTYRFIVNGRTGEVQGERPYSAWKIALAVLLALLLAAAIGYVVALEQR
ncbi:MAG TPA: primosomal protein N' (replication factor Y) - superfamily II helicase [Paracoccaceae bacterium]|nr:primosomal protein N' (replication factor Y) - superfamily II helicase [Paracoccaceae bacterium]